MTRIASIATAAGLQNSFTNRVLEDFEGGMVYFDNFRASYAPGTADVEFITVNTGCKCNGVPS